MAELYLSDSTWLRPIHRFRSSMEACDLGGTSAGEYESGFESENSVVRGKVFMVPVSQVGKSCASALLI